ncbi:MAG: DUF6074 family protein [Devosia sp.]
MQTLWIYRDRDRKQIPETETETKQNKNLKPESTEQGEFCICGAIAGLGKQRTIRNYEGRVMKDHGPYQLDLFANPAKTAPETRPAGCQVEDFRHATATVLRFPVERWAPRLWLGKVDKIASLIMERKTERGRANLWRTTIETLFAQMRRRGAGLDEIEVQIADFHAAVSWALSDQQSGPGAA